MHLALHLSLGEGLGEGLAVSKVRISTAGPDLGFQFGVEDRPI